MSTAIDQKFWKPREVANLLRISVMTVYRMIEIGELDAIRIGRSFRIPDHAVQPILKAGVRTTTTATSGDGPAEPEVTATLRSLIIAGKLRRGVPLSPRDIATRLNASAEDVSEALTALLREGFLKTDQDGCLIVPRKSARLAGSR